MLVVSRAMAERARRLQAVLHEYGIGSEIRGEAPVARADSAAQRPCTYRTGQKGQRSGLQGQEPGRRHPGPLRKHLGASGTGTHVGLTGSGEAGRISRHWSEVFGQPATMGWAMEEGTVTEGKGVSKECTSEERGNRAHRSVQLREKLVSLTGGRWESRPEEKGMFLWGLPIADCGIGNGRRGRGASGSGRSDRQCHPRHLQSGRL